MQTDPIGYGAGMNWYAYCGNNALNRVDPSGLYWTFLDSWYVDRYFSRYSGQVVFAWVDDADTNRDEPNPDNVDIEWHGSSLDDWYDDAPEYFEKQDKVPGWKMEDQVGWEFSGCLWPRAKRHDRSWYFWRLQAMSFLSHDVGQTIAAIEGLTGDLGANPSAF